MSNRDPNYEKIVAHHKKLQSVVSAWDTAIEDAKKKISKEHNQRRNDLKDKLKKSKDEENEVNSKYQRNEMHFQQELAKITAQIDAMESQPMPAPDISADIQRKNQQIEQIYGETHKEIIIVLDRHRERVKRMEQIVARNASQEKKMSNLGTGLTGVAPIKTVLDLKKAHMKETINNLESNREEIEKKFKELAEIEKKEAEDIEVAERNTTESEAKDRNEEMNKFVNKMKDIFKKH